MKTMKMMFAAILLCGTSVSVQAQNDYYETKDEVAVSIGTVTNTQFMNVFSDLFGVLGEALITGVMTGGHYVGTTTYADEKYVPALSAEYFHHISKVVSVGGIAAFNGYSRDMYCNWQSSDGSTRKEKVGKGEKYFATLMPAVKFDWLRKKNFGLYSKAAVGVTYMFEKEVQDNHGESKKVNDDSKLMFNFHATLLGVEAGSQKLRGFIELGVGEQGMMQAGVRYKF